MSLPAEHDLIGAYVLNALEDDERAAVERYLQNSPEAAAEVRELREALVALASVAAEPPPASLKASVMAEVDRTWQDPAPITAIGPSAADQRDAPVEHVRVEHLRVEHDLTAEQDLTAEPSSDQMISLDDRRRDRAATSPWTRFALAGGAVAAGLAVVLGLSLGQLNDRIDRLEQTADQIAAVVAADDARRLAVDVTGGGTLSAVVSVEDGAAVVVTTGLSAISEDLIYALWAIDGGEATPVGELTDGEALPVTSDFELIGLTVEPAGPLDQPTGEILALLDA